MSKCFSVFSNTLSLVMLEFSTLALEENKRETQEGTVHHKQQTHSWLSKYYLLAWKTQIQDSATLILSLGFTFISFC